MQTRQPRQLVSQYLLEKYLGGEQRGSMPAAAVFADLSGFSAITDELARHGDRGAEILAEAMREFFEPLVEAVYRHGGFVVGYAGDAFTGIFCEGPDLNTLAKHALASAAAMQAHVRSKPRIITEFGDAPISIRAGVGAGEVSWLFLKDGTGEHVTYCVRGSSVDGAVAAEGAAPPGGTVLDAAAHEILKTMVTSLPLGRCHQVIDVTGPLPHAREFRVPDARREEMAPFLPKSVLMESPTGEFRQVVNVFIDIPIDPTDETFVVPFMESVFALQERYGGFFLRPEMGDKGFNLLIFWGAPTAHENDIDRALNFVLDLQERTQLSLRAGITYEMAYAGFMGAALREDYTAYGRGVNLAARMMEAAPGGEVWMDSDVSSRAQRHFHARELGEFSLKGMARPVRVSALEGRKKLIELAFAGELVERQEELMKLTQFLAPLQEGKPAGLMVVKGEAGIGKSRLVHSLQFSTLFQKMPALWAVCQADEIQGDAFRPFKDWLMKAFAVSGDQGTDVNLRNFEKNLQGLTALAGDPVLAKELKRTSSVLAALLNIEQSVSLYGQLDAKGRYDNTMIALSAVLRALSRQKPLILLVEDLQWLDDSSCDFLAYFIRTLQIDPAERYPVAVIVTSRPDAQLPELEDKGWLHCLELNRLTSASVRQLAQDVLRAGVAPGLHKMLDERSEGNPFFANQLLQYLVENDLLLRMPDGSLDAARWETNIPRDVQAFLIARLDKLRPDVRTVVQTASVLGREFETRLLGKILEGDSGLQKKMGYAEDAKIWFPLNELEYIFQHALLRDAAYSMQLVARLRQLHSLALEAMEALYAADLAPHVPELAYHAERANLGEKARGYLVQAGVQAAAAYQNGQAIDYFSRALGLTPSEDFATRFELVRQRTELYSRIGDRERQLADLDWLEDLAEKTGGESARACALALRSSYHFVTGAYSRAANTAERAIRAASSCGETDAALDSYSIWAISLLRQSQLRLAMDTAKKGLELAQSLGRRAQEGAILNSMGMIAVEAKDSNSAQVYLERALEIAREIHVPGLEARAFTNLGNVAGSLRSDFTAAHHYYEQAIAEVQEWGDRYAEGLLVCNLAWVAGMQGDFDSARTYHQQALSIAREVGNPYQEAYTLINLSGLAGIQGDSATASEAARKAYAISHRMGYRRGESFSLLNLGHALLQVEEFEQARETFMRCIHLAKELEQPGFEIEPMAGLIQVAVQMDDLKDASRWTEELLTRLETSGGLDGTEEPLRVYHACHEALLKMNDPRADKLLEEAAKVLEEQVSNFPDEPARRVFIRSAPWRQAIQSAWEAGQSTRGPIQSADRQP